MKYLSFLMALVISILPVYGNVLPKDLKCSQAGTDVLFVNGISWGRKTVEYILYKQIEPNVPKSYLDKKLPADTYVKVKYSYNHANGFLRDILESVAQKASQNFKISINEAIVATYYTLFPSGAKLDFFVNIFISKRVTFSEISNYIKKTVEPNYIDKMIQDSLIENVIDTTGLKISMSKTILNKKKLILITESQGNFFANQVIQEYLNGANFNYGGKTAKIKDFLRVIGQLQISPPTRSLLQKNKVVLNNLDIINLIFFDRPESNFDLIKPSPDLREDYIDRHANHYITSTYLNDENMLTGNLQKLKEFTLQSVVDVAGLLESNCLKAVINYTKQDQVVNFDSSDPENPNASELTYEWNFGDGITLTTTNPKFSHTYENKGTYQVTLTVTDKYGSKEVKSIEIEIEKNPIGDMKICAVGPTNVTFDFAINNPTNDNFSVSFYSGKCECKSIKTTGEMTDFTLRLNYQGESRVFENIGAINGTNVLFTFGIGAYFHSVLRSIDGLNLTATNDVEGECTEIIEK